MNIEIIYNFQQFLFGINKRMIKGQLMVPAQIKNGSAQMGQYEISLIVQYQHLRKYHVSLHEQYQKELASHKYNLNENQEFSNMMVVNLTKFTQQKINQIKILDEKITKKNIHSQQASDLQNGLKISDKEAQKKLQRKKQKEQKLQSLRSQNLQNLTKLSIIQSLNYNQHNQKERINKYFCQISKRIKQQHQKINIKKQRNSALQVQIDQKQNKQALVHQKIEQIQNKISDNTKIIQCKLNDYSTILKKYEQIKATKKKIEQQKDVVKRLIKQTQDTTLLLESFQQKWQNQQSTISKKIFQENVQYQMIKSEYSEQILRKNCNQECLNELKNYVQQLTEQNKIIQEYVEKIYSQDQFIKGLIDSKHYKNRSEFWGKPNNTYNKTKVRMISRLSEYQNAAEDTYPHSFYRNSKYQSQVSKISHKKGSSIFSTKGN